MNDFYMYQNFNMGRELDIAATFIYRGVKGFDELRCFRDECDIFHVLYDLSVGIERLQKTLLVLYSGLSAGSTEAEISSFEKSLITHAHQELHKRIYAHTHLAFNENQNAFLQMLARFYVSCRYNRYVASENFDKEKELLVSFLQSRMGITISASGDLRDTPNTIQIKRFFLKIVGTISRSYYRYLEERARSLNLYTYEKRYDSAAYKLFLGNYKDDSFYELIVNEKVAISEFFIYLINRKGQEEMTKHLYGIPALDLDINEINVYFDGISRNSVPSVLEDAVQCIYEELDDRKERFGLMLALHYQ